MQRLGFIVIPQKELPPRSLHPLIVFTTIFIYFNTDVAK